MEQDIGRPAFRSLVKTYINIKIEFSWSPFQFYHSSGDNSTSYVIIDVANQMTDLKARVEKVAPYY